MKAKQSNNKSVALFNQLGSRIKNFIDLVLVFENMRTRFLPDKSFCTYFFDDLFIIV